MKTAALELAVLGSGWTRDRKLQVERVLRPCSLLGKPECCSAMEVERGCRGGRRGAPRLRLTQSERRLAHPGSFLGLCSSQLLQATRWAERPLGEPTAPALLPSLSTLSRWNRLGPALPHPKAPSETLETGCSFKVKFNTQGPTAPGNPRPAPVLHACSVGEATSALSGVSSCPTSWALCKGMRQNMPSACELLRAGLEGPC